MIEKSADAKLYEQADLLLDGFRDSVRDAQEHAQHAGVEYAFVVNGRRYLAFPNGDIKRHAPDNGE